WGRPFFHPLAAEENMSVNREWEAQLRRTVHDHRGLFIVEGAILLVLGAAAIGLPPIAGLAVTLVVGWLFVIGGFVWALWSAILSIVACGVLLWDPWAGLITLTYVLIAFFRGDGVLMIARAV